VAARAVCTGVAKFCTFCGRILRNLLLVADFHLTFSGTDVGFTTRAKRPCSHGGWWKRPNASDLTQNHPGGLIVRKTVFAVLLIACFVSVAAAADRVASVARPDVVAGPRMAVHPFVNKAEIEATGTKIFVSDF